MSVTLWIDEAKDETIELGPTLHVYRAFDEMIDVAGSEWTTTYSGLAGVLDLCERQEDADPEWLAKVRAKAALMLERNGPALSSFSQEVLRKLIGDG